MSWKIIGLVESRSGDIAILPEWCIGKPNDFANHAEAVQIQEAMQAVHVKAKEKTPIRYLVMPAIDETLIKQVRGIAHPEPTPQIPALSFGGKQQPPPA
jgi:hypothetical protein